MILHFQTSDGQFKYTDRLKAPLPDFKNIEYKGEKPWKSTEASKDFIKKVIIENKGHSIFNLLKSAAILSFI